MERDLPRCLAGAVEKAEEEPFQRADGRLEWVRWEIRPWYESNGEIGGIVLVSEVITERKEAEEKIRRSEEQYRLLFENNPLPMWVYDLQTLRFARPPGATEELLHITTIERPPRKGGAPVTRRKALAKISEKHVLLVEDNEVNQIVAAEMMENLGMVVSVASSGEDALAMLEGLRFDLVVMDIRMPGMDGYQTTAKIRSQPQFSIEKLPIIALSAHALTSEREKALRAGMNDYLAKPVDVELLAEILLRWLGPGESPTPVNAHCDPAAPADDALSGALEIQPAVERLGGDWALYKRLLEKFRAVDAGAVENIRRVAQAGDYAQATRLSHTLKGVAATIGAQALHAAAEKLEAALMEHDRAAVAEHLETLGKQLELALKAAGEF